MDPAAVERARDQVEARRQAEREQYGGGGSGGSDDEEIDSRFVLDCLHANVEGDAELYKRLLKKRLLYNKSMAKWMVWTGHHWDIDYMDENLAAVSEVLTEYQREIIRSRAEIDTLEKEGGQDDRVMSLKKTIDLLRKRIWQLREPRRRNACVQFVHTTENPMAIRGEEMDQNPYLLACANGVIDLKTGTLLDGHQEQYLLKACPVEFTGIDTPCPQFEQFLAEIFEEREAIVQFMQRLLGMSIIGETPEHIIAVFNGRGRNGKGTLVEIMGHVLGDLAGPIRSEMLLDQGRNVSADGPSPGIMTLRGLRIAFASETDEHARVSAARVKWLTGGDELRARNPNDKFEVRFRPTHTLILLTNHNPHAPADDYAFWERVILIPFLLSYVNREPRADFERKADLDLPKKLRAEASGILAWLVRGCLLWQQQGLNPPPAVRAAVAEYRKDEDILGDFIEECLETVADDLKGEGSTVIYEAFSWWYKRNIKPKVPAQRWFSKRFDKRFHKEKKSGLMRFYGCRVRAEVADEIQSDLDRESGGKGKGLFS